MTVEEEIKFYEEQNKWLYEQLCILRDNYAKQSEKLKALIDEINREIEKTNEFEIEFYEEQKEEDSKHKKVTVGIALGTLALGLLGGKLCRKW